MEKEKDYKLTVRVSQEELKAVKMFVLQHDTTVQDFLYNSYHYCMKNKVLPGDK